MREIFSVTPADPGRVFYTILPEDVGKTVIKTEIGSIDLSDGIGPVLPGDTGKRVYRTPNHAGDHWFWQIESDYQYHKRTRSSSEPYSSRER